MTWLPRAGDAPAALRLLEVLEPFAGTLCLTPRPVPGARAGAGTGAGSGSALAEHSVSPWAASGALARLCRRRAGGPSGGVAAGGMVIEQAQTLTAHSLALLGDLGARPDLGWAGAAWDAYETVVGVLVRLSRVEGRLGHVENAAFAWRQCVYFLSRCPEEEQRAALEDMTDRIAYPRHTGEVQTPVLAGLRQAVAGRTQVEEEGRVRLFLGWSNRRHWVLRALREAVPRDWAPLSDTGQAGAGHPSTASRTGAHADPRGSRVRTPPQRG